MLLAADVGGTHTRLGLFDRGDLKRAATEATFPSGAYSDLASVVRKFLGGGGPRISAAGIGVAGPVHEGRCETTNLPWVVDAADLGRELGTEHVRLVNDLEANAHGIASLGPEDFALLSSGKPDSGGNAARVSAGSGRADDAGPGCVVSLPAGEVASPQAASSAARNRLVARGAGFMMTS